MKFVHLYSILITQISKAEAIMAKVSGTKLVNILQDENKSVGFDTPPFRLSFTQ